MRSMRLAAVLLLLCGSAAASQTWTRGEVTAKQLKAVEAHVAYNLRDPQSARFRNVFRAVGSEGSEAFCGEVNAKNAYGAYTGFTAFYWNPGIGDQVYMDGDDQAGTEIIAALCPAS